MIYIFKIEMQNENNDNQNYLISIQTIDQKNISSSFNNLNSIVSLDTINKQNDNHKYLFSNFRKMKFGKINENEHFKSEEMLPSIQKTILKKVTNGFKSLFTKTFKRKKDFEVNFEKKKKFLSSQYLTELIKNVDHKTKIGRIYYKIKKIHLLISICLLISIISGIIDITINKNQSFSIIKDGYINNNKYELILNRLKNRKLTSFENFLRINSIFCSLIMMIFLLRKEFLIHKYNLINESLKRRLIIFIICLFFFPPLINPILIIKQKDIIYPFFIVDFYFIINLSKIFILCILNIEHTQWASSLSQIICNNFSVKSKYYFSLRSTLQNKPFLNIFIIIFILVIFFLFILRNFEFATFFIHKSPIQNYELSFQQYINTVWLIIMVFFSVAYGDYYPKTIFSRLIMLIMILIGLIFLTYFLHNIMKYTIMTENEKKVFLKMKKLYSHENLEFKSVKVIYYLLQLKKEIILYNKQTVKFIKILYLKKMICYILMFYRYIKNFDNNDKIAEKYSIPVDDLINNVENKINENLINFETSFSKLEQIENDLDNLINLQKKISSNMKIILNYQDNIGSFIVEKNNLTVMERIKGTFSLSSKNIKYLNKSDLFRTFEKKRKKNISSTPSLHRKKKSLKIILDTSLIPENDEDFDTNTINKNSKFLTSQRLPIIKPDKEFIFKNGIENKFLSHRYFNSGLKKNSSYLSFSSLN